jgi:hypothetical protein
MHMRKTETTSEKERNKGNGCEASAKAPGLAEYVMSVLEEARRRNPGLVHLDRLAEVLPPRRMTYWPYLVGRWNTE